jgi:tetratricopeptide (TPR) repeat protein
MDPKLLAAGIEHHRSGNFQRAREIYLELLAANPKEALAYNLLGAVCLDSRQLNEAANYLIDALRLDPGFAAAFDNLGLLLMLQDKLGEAIVSFRRAVTLDPQNAQTQRNLANALTRGGQLAGAIEALRQVVQLVPENALAHFELATALVHAGQKSEAIAAYRTAVRLKPDLAEACVNLAKLYFEEKSFDEAVSWARRAVELRPQFADALHNLGCALTKQGKYEEAIEALQTAVRLEPKLTEADNNLGVALTESGNFDAAVEHYRRALTIRPDDAEVFYNLGTVYLKLGKMQTAIEHLNRAIELRPDYAEAHYNRAGALLLDGEFAEGFPEYEWRFRLKEHASTRFPWKLWNGEPLAGRTIVLCFEGGSGDVLQFVRYAPLVKEQGARVLVACKPAHYPILSRTPGIDGLHSPEIEMFEADVCVSMMSLPYRMHTTLETVPATIPYVFADPQLVAAWQQRLARWDGFKVGIVWQGSPQFSGDRQRSIPLANYSPLAKVRGVRLVNLQKGPGLEQLSDFAESSPIVDFSDEVDTLAGAFMDTAAIMKNLDLVITSDTATAHLAGALGVNVWLALQRVPECRWMLEREDSPWYPTMRLFRQTRFGDWPDVFERIAGELERCVAGSRETSRRSEN